jgi:CDP-diacylglycerol--glycerol-3-phosphate 3-phosphatidyltransferase
VVLVPVLVVLVAMNTRTASYVATGVFLLGAASDGLDGYLARRGKGEATTATGQWLDPLSDKLFVSATEHALTATDRYPLWAAIVIVAREVAVSLLRWSRGSRGEPMPASEWGKVKTGAQLIAISLYLLPLGPEAASARNAALYLAVGLTVFSGLDYLVRAPRGARRTDT